MKIIHQKLLAILATPHWTQSKVAERLGVSQSSINRWTKGTEPEGDHRDALADLYNEVFGYSPDETNMRVRGSIGPDQILRILDRAEQGWVERPPSNAKALTAAVVSGDSMMPIFMREWIIFYGDPIQPKDAINEMVVAQLTDGRNIVRKLLRGSGEGKWTLTIPSASDIVDVEIEHVCSIEWVKPMVFGPSSF